MSSASRVSTRLEGPAAMRIPDFLIFTGPKNKSRERQASDYIRNLRASPAWVIQYRVLLGYAPRNGASLCPKNYIAFNPKSGRFFRNR
jgi:hypothetical protein